jgi:hypothetical protein
MGVLFAAVHECAVGTTQKRLSVADKFRLVR